MSAIKLNKITHQRVCAAVFVILAMLIIGCVDNDKTSTSDTKDNLTTPQRWLIVSAHPDDEAKASGLVFTERKPGDELVILVMRLTGESLLPGRKDVTREQAINHRSGEMDKSAAFFNADELRWWRPPHPENENIAKTPETVEKMVSLLKEIKPTRIITHWGKGDSHPDHAGTAVVINEAIKQFGAQQGLKAVYYFGQPTREDELLNFNPNYYADISKPAILASVLWSRGVHKSQLDFNTVKTYLEYYKKNGQKAGVEYADAFVMKKL